MGILIDSSVFIGHERGRIDLNRRLSDHEDEEMALSVVTASELLHGIHRAHDAATRTKRSAFVEAILASFPVLNIDLNTARAHAQIGAELMSAGNSIGQNDLWIAATCVAHGLGIATNNVREFQRVPGLRVLSW